MIGERTRRIQFHRLLVESLGCGVVFSLLSKRTQAAEGIGASRIEFRCPAKPAFRRICILALEEFDKPEATGSEGIVRPISEDGFIETLRFLVLAMLVESIGFGTIFRQATSRYARKSQARTV